MFNIIHYHRNANQNHNEVPSHASQNQFSSVAQSCPTLCNPMNCSTPAFPVHHQLPELAQTHVHGVGDAIQPSHPPLSPSPAFSLSQHHSNELVLCIRWPKYCSFRISPSVCHHYLIKYFLFIEYYL